MIDKTEAEVVCTQKKDKPGCAATLEQKTDLQSRQEFGIEAVDGRWQLSGISEGPCLTCT